jgi:hypothetical protein
MKFPIYLSSLVLPVNLSVLTAAREQRSREWGRTIAALCGCSNSNQSIWIFLGPVGKSNIGEEGGLITNPVSG